MGPGHLLLQGHEVALAARGVHLELGDQGVAHLRHRARLRQQALHAGADRIQPVAGAAAQVQEGDLFVQVARDSLSERADTTQVEEIMAKKRLQTVRPLAPNGP